MHQQRKDVCGLSIKLTVLLSQTHVCHFLRGHAYTYICMRVHVLTVGVMVCSLCVFSCPQTLLASVEKELTFEELYLLRGIAMAKVKRKLATVEVSEGHVQHRVVGM